MRRRRETLRPHKTRNAIVDLMRSCGEPLSPSRIHEITGESLGTVAYHCRTLRSAGVIRIAREVRVRGAVKTFFELVPENAGGVEDVEQQLLRVAGALSVPSDQGDPELTVLDDKARTQLLAEAKRLTPRVRKIAEEANKRARRVSRNGRSAAGGRHENKRGGV